MQLPACSLILFMRRAGLAAVMLVAAQATWPQGSEQAMLRVACDDANVGAEVFINGQSKGRCPVDVPVNAGTVRLRAVKKVSASRESLFEQVLQMAGGTVKRIDVELGAPQLTADGLKIEEAQRLREREQAQREELERRRQMAQSFIDEQVKVEAVIAPYMAAARAQRISAGNSSSTCPDCPQPLKRPDKLDLPMPVVEKAEFRRWQEPARQKLERYFASAGADFSPPEKALPMPCESAAFAMRKLADLLSVSEWTFDAQRGFRKGFANRPTPPAQYVRDVKLWPVQASCAQGQLDGPLEFWAFGHVVVGLGDLIDVTPWLIHINTQMRAGKAAGVIEELKYSGSSVVKLSRASANADWVEKDLASHQVKGGRLTVAYRYDTAAVNEYGLAMIVSVSFNPQLQSVTSYPYTETTWYRGDSRTEVTFYEGARRSMLSLYRFGRLNGVSTRLGYSIPGGFLKSDTQVPSSTTCFEDNVPVNKKPCPWE